MSLLIKGMEIPNNCAECPINMVVCHYGYQYLIDHPELYDKRAETCPIQFIPYPHGRLIDGDRLETKMKNRKFMIGRESDPECLVIDSCTIIPAEKE